MLYILQVQNIKSRLRGKRELLSSDFTFHQPQSFSHHVFILHLCRLSLLSLCRCSNPLQIWHKWNRNLLCFVNKGNFRLSLTLKQISSDTETQLNQSNSVLLICKLSLQDRVGLSEAVSTTQTERCHCWLWRDSRCSQAASVSGLFVPSKAWEAVNWECATCYWDECISDNVNFRHFKTGLWAEEKSLQLFYSLDLE